MKLKKQIESNAARTFLLISLIVLLTSGLMTGNANSRSRKPFKTLKYGERAVFNAMMQGAIPWQWQVRAGGAVAPSTLLWPVEGRGIGRGFGSRGGTHLAIDITAPVGTPIRAVARGVVLYANNEIKGYGKLMLVLHPGGSVSLYAHLDDYKAVPGQLIDRGQVIAIVGNTGISRGPHLHFALFENGKPVNPEPRFQTIPSRRPAADIARRE
jgi:murein DD-endopeptidase MepM/ murein hydrolase activator NlpD